MGDVVLCTDHLVGRDVAMKVMRADIDTDEELRVRFLREARVQGQLEHPCIVPLYDMGRDTDGNAFFTMKRVRGQTLEKIIARLAAREPGALVAYSRRKLLAAFGQACLAVDFAHAHGVLHRDLKPSNIMIGDFGEVYVLDWGVAKVVDNRRGGSTATLSTDDVETLTPMGEVIGTLGYMPPEQATGALEALDQRADVYALGAILFELLTLDPLHLGFGKASLLASTLQGADARCSKRAPEREVPPGLEAICVKATASRSADRFRSARELVDALERYLDGDRDLERRREASRRLTQRGLVAAARSTCDRAETEPARREALQALGRAVALDPANEAAAEQLVELLTSEPREVPREVRAEIREEKRKQQQVRAFWGAVGAALWFPFLAILASFGIRSVIGLAVALVTWAPLVWHIVRTARRPTREGDATMRVYLLAGLALTGTSAVFGPLVMVPTMAVAMVLVLSLGTDRSHRWALWLVATLALLVPYGLEWAGLVPPAYGFVDGAMVVLPRTIALTPRTAPVVLLLVNFMILATCALLAGRLRDLLLEAQRRVHVHAWQLRQVLPRRRSRG